MVGTPGPSAVERVGWLRARPGWVGGCRRTLAETACGWELGADLLSPQALVVSRWPLSAVPIPATPLPGPPALAIPTPWPRSPLPVFGLFLSDLASGFCLQSLRLLIHSSPPPFCFPPQSLGPSPPAPVTWNRYQYRYLSLAVS